MKGFLKKKWHRIPVALVSVILVLVLGASSAFAVYPFLTAKVEVVVEEAIGLSIDAVDDLAPYMEPAGVVPEIILTTGTGGYDLDVTIQAGSEDASEFCPGETLVIPVNLRNRSDGSITVDVTSAYAAPLVVQFSWNGTNWFDSANRTMAGHEGAFGSGDAGAVVLYIKIYAPGDCPPGTQTFSLNFERS